MIGAIRLKAGALAAAAVGAGLLAACAGADPQVAGERQTLRERLQARRDDPAPVPPIVEGGRRAEETLEHGGRTRRYLIHDFSGGRPAPVVIAMHGGGGNAENAVNMTQFDAVARRERFIMVYPEGTTRQEGGRLMTWNADHCCAFAMEADIDDVGFIGKVIDGLVASGRADPQRIYATGMSNGGMMSHRLGRELSAKLAGIAPVVGAVFGGEAPPQAPTPAFIIVGADDTVVPGAGGPLQLRAVLGNRSAADKDTAPAIAQAEYWAKANGCGEAKTTTTAAATTMTWTGCSSGADVVYHVVANNGHAWPGGRPGREGANVPSQALNASEEMWAFFKTRKRG